MASHVKRMDMNIRTKGDRDQVVEQIQGLDLNKRWHITIKEGSKGRSLAMNRLLWMWNNCIQEHVREHQGIIASTEEIHEVMVCKLLPSETEVIMGELIVRRKATRSMSVPEFQQYLELLEMYCLDSLGLELPKPEDIYFEALMQSEEPTPEDTQ